MPTNAIIVYDLFLELLHLRERERNESLRFIFNRDISDNINFKFNNKLVRPLTAIDGSVDIEATFHHCITQDDYDENNK
ncbi:MAG: hypothetical protein RL607_1607, partial [Bacteroidota bacterium]